MLHSPSASATLLAVILVPCLSHGPRAQAPDTPYHVAKAAATGSATIQPEQLRTWLTKLTSREFAGRGTGQKGFGRAAEYVRNHFKQLGLAPGGEDGGYFQVVPWEGRFPDLEKTRLSVRKGDEVILEVTGATGLNGQVTKALEVSGKAAYLELHRWLRRPDFEDLDLEGKVVFLRVTAKPGRGNLFTPTKVLEAESYAALARRLSRAGAAAVVSVTDTVGGQAGALVGSSWMKGGSRAVRGMQQRVVEALFVDRAAMGKILAAAPKPGKGERHELRNADGDVVATMLDLKDLAASLAVKMETDEATAAPACNVVGLLPGTDPKLKEEYVAIGCHLDHLGVRTGVIHPGADDDGSGSAALMAISQAFAKNQVRPRRSILFLAFCGEEKGLIGSGYFASRCHREGKPIKLSQLAAELQVDMIGRNETLRSEMGPREKAEDNLNTLHLIGSKKLSTDLHDLCMRVNQRAGFELEWDAENVFYRSDHWNFAKYGVPIAFFFTGFHGQYHQPEDTVEKIDFPKLARVAAYVYDIAFELAQADARPLVDPGKWRRIRRMQRRAPDEPAAPLRKEQEPKAEGQKPKREEEQPEPKKR